MSEWARTVEDLEVFRRASVEIDLRQSRRGFRQAATVAFRVPSLSVDGDRLGRRDAGVDAVLPRSRLCRCGDGGGLAGEYNEIARMLTALHRGGSDI